MTDALDRLKAALANRYAIERELGRGGMATVYLAEDLKHHRHVAIKVLDPDLARALGAERFLREVEVTANLTHPHILTLIDSGEADGFLYYVMPYIEGETLRERMNREGQLPLDDALQITREVAAALSYAHSHDVIHRDIKPENVLLSAGEAVVADFGIARAITEAGGEHLTETGISIGTPAYMSPEQASGEQRIDGRSDVYSLGCVLYEMLAGEPPYTGPNHQAVLAKKLSEPVPGLAVVRETVPAPVEEIIRRTLARAPADRYPTARVFAEALKVPFSGKGEAPPIQTPRSRIGPAFVSTVVVILVLAGGWLGWRLFQQTRGNGNAGEVPRIAVLPCRTDGPRPVDTWISTQAIHGELIRTLQKIPTLETLAQEAVYHLRDEAGPLPQMAANLSLDFIGTCDVQLSATGDRVRLSFELMDANGVSVLAHSFNRERSSAGVIDLPVEVAELVAAKMNAKISSAELERIRKRPTNLQSAYELSMQGRELADRRDHESLRQAILLFQAAIEQDSTFAVAFAGIADAHAMLPWSDPEVESIEICEDGLAAARRAVDLDDTLAEAKVTYGFLLLQCDFDYALAQRQLLDALELAPGNPRVLNSYGSLLQALGDQEGAAKYCRRALDLNPGSGSWMSTCGTKHFWAKKVEEARILHEEAMRMSPRPPWTFAYFASNLLLLDPKDPERAKQVLSDGFADEFQYPYPEKVPVLVDAWDGPPELQAQAGPVLDEISELTKLAPADLLFFYAASAPPDRFFAVLEEAVNQRSSWVAWLPAFPFLPQQIREDPRWQQFLSRIRYPGPSGASR
jgi:TolB-like protein